MVRQRGVFKKDRKEQGVSTSDKGVFIPKENRAPYAPQNIGLTKAEFVEQEEKRREKALEMAKLSREYDQKRKSQEEEKKIPEKAPVGISSPVEGEAKENVKSRGRPRKTD